MKAATVKAGTVEQVGPGLVRVWTRDGWDYFRYCFHADHPAWTSRPAVDLEYVAACPHCVVRLSAQSGIDRSHELKRLAQAQGLTLA
jgi:hypothetical protein